MQQYFTINTIACAHFCDVVKSPQVLDGTGKVETIEGFAECAVPMTLEKQRNKIRICLKGGFISAVEKKSVKKKISASGLTSFVLPFCT